MATAFCAANITFNGAGSYLINSSNSGNDGFINLGPSSGAAVITTNANAEIDAQIEPNGGVTKFGAGTLYVTCNNGIGPASNYWSTINVAQGTLEFGPTALDNAYLAFSGGTVQWAPGNSEDISNPAVGIPLDSTHAPANLDTNGNNVTFGSAITVTGANGLTKLGAGQLIFNANQTYTGPTNVSNGTLVLNSGSAPQSSLMTVSGSGVLLCNQPYLALNPVTIGAGGRVTCPSGGNVILRRPDLGRRHAQRKQLVSERAGQCHAELDDRRGQRQLRDVPVVSWNQRRDHHRAQRRPQRAGNVRNERQLYAHVGQQGDDGADQLQQHLRRADDDRRRDVAAWRRRIQRQWPMDEFALCEQLRHGD